MKKTVLILFLFFTGVAYAQQSRTGSLLAHIDSLIVTAPSAIFGNQYKVPDARQLRLWDTVVINILSSNYAFANTVADSLGYKLLDFLDTTQTPAKNYYILEKRQDSTNNWGAFVFNPDPLRQSLFIQAPHPLFDTKSGQQAIYAYKNIGARLYAVAGTHRCNHSDTSVCTGTTAVCGVSGRFQVSDQPHNINNTFYRSTVIANSMIPNLIVVQLHGFGKDSLDPDVIMGNGTNRTPLLTSTDYLIEFKNNLHSIDTALTFRIAHIDTTWTRLTGTVNMQGRHINGAPNPCTGSNASIPTPNGRFLHIEQVLWLRNTQAGKDKVKDALAMTFPVNPLPVSFITFTATKTSNDQALLEWTTASESNTEKFVVEMSYDNRIFTEAGIVKAAGYSNTVVHYSFTQQVAAVHPVIYFRIRCVDYDRSFSNTKVAAIYNSSLSAIDLDVSPNPYVNEIRLKYASETDEQIMVTITGIDGVVLHKQYFAVSKGENILLIHPSQVRNGLAVLTIQRENGVIFNRKITRI